MKSYSSLIVLALFASQHVSASDFSEPQNPSPLAHPAIPLRPDLAEKLFVSAPEKYLSCPTLFNQNWISPNGPSQSLCNDAQLACLRYGLMVEKTKTAQGPLLQELKRQIPVERQEVYLRLRGCQLILEATVLDGKTLIEAAGYPSAGSPYAPYSTSSK